MVNLIHLNILLGIMIMIYKTIIFIHFANGWIY